MPSLKDLRVRITSVKSTQKITSAMKMVAASKLRRAQTAAEEARPYANRMARMLGELTASMPTLDAAPPLLVGTGHDRTHLIVVVTGDRGLCGGFNANIVREVRRRANTLLQEGKTVRLLCVGRKGRDGLKRDLSENIVAVDDFAEVTERSHALELPGPRLVGVVLVGDFQGRFATHQSGFVPVAVTGRIHIGDRHDLNIIVAHEELHVRCAPSPCANHSDIDAVARCISPENGTGDIGLRQRA